MSRRSAIFLSILLGVSFLVAVFWRDILAGTFLLAALHFLRHGVRS